MATITQAQTVSIVELYIAFFGRAPEHSGLEFWKAELSAAIDAGVDADTAMNTVADRFYDAALQYSAQTGYNQDTTITAFVEETYSNVLLRTGAMAPDASEIAYWVGRYGDGLSRGEVVREMISDAKAFAGDPEFGGIVATLSNRTTVGLEFAEEDNSGDLSGVEAYAAGKAALAGVDATDASVDAAISAFAGPPEGTVIDGKVAGATVGIDVNGDGVISDDEPTVTTDAQGNYEFPDGTPRGTVIASGGTDLSTGLAFEGELTAPSGSDVVSPLTTLIDRIAQGDTDPNKTQAEKVADAQTQLKALLGLSDVDADLTKFDVVTETSENDPSGADGLSDGNALRLYAASVKLMNVIEQGAAAIEGAGNVDGKTAFKAMVDALSGELRGGSGPVDLNSGDSQTIVNAINGAASQTLDADGQAKVAGIAQSAAKIAAAGNTEVDNALEALGAGDPVNPNDPDSGSSINDALVSIVKSQKAVQGDGADQIRQGAQNGEDGADAANDFSDGNGGINDDVQNNQNVGDVNGDGQDDDGEEGAENDGGGGSTGGGGGNSGGGNTGGNGGDEEVDSSPTYVLPDSSTDSIKEVLVTGDRSELASVKSANDPEGNRGTVVELTTDPLGTTDPEAYGRYQGVMLADGDESLDLQHGSTFSANLYLDDEWGNDGVSQTTGIWMDLGDANGNASGYPIAEFVDADALEGLDNPGLTLDATDIGAFRFYNPDTGAWESYTAVSADDAGWVDVSFAFGEKEHSWVIEDADGNELASYSYDDSGDTTVVSDSEFIRTAFFNSQNYGDADPSTTGDAGESYYVDNVSFTGPNYVLPDSSTDSIKEVLVTGDRSELASVKSANDPEGNRGTVVELTTDPLGTTDPEAYGRYQGVMLADGDESLDLQHGSTFSANLYLDDEWGNDGVSQTTGIWMDLGDANGNASGYPIAEFVDADALEGLDNPGLTLDATDIGAFRFYNPDTGAWESYTAVSADDAGWVDVSFAFGEKEHSWVIEDADGNELASYSYDDSGDTTVVSDSEFIRTAFFNSQNYGDADPSTTGDAGESYYVDNVSFTGISNNPTGFGDGDLS